MLVAATALLGTASAPVVAAPVKIDAVVSLKEQIRLDFADGSKHSLKAGVAVIFASWALCAAALDRAGAVDAARRQVTKRCTAMTPCIYSAKPEENKWYVRVQFTKRKSPLEEPFTYPGGQAMFIVNQSGKVVGRIEGN